MPMLDNEQQKKIINFIQDELQRIHFGHVFIDLTIMKGTCTNIQAETKRSQNINKRE